MPQQPESSSTKILFFADSILRGSNAFSSVTPYTSRRSNSELVASLRSLLDNLGEDKAELSSGQKYAWDAAAETLSIPSPQALEHDSGRDAREDLDVTAKFFYLAPGPVASTSRLPAEWTDGALDALKAATGMEEVDTFILSFPGIIYPEDGLDGADGCSDCDDENARGPTALINGTVHSSQHLRTVLKTYETISRNQRIRKLGLADFALEPLTDFLNELDPGARKPQVDQINLRDCCTVSRALRDFAARRDIELLTHADCSDLLPPKTFTKLLTHVETRLPSVLRSSELHALWVLKYTIVHKSRNVVKDKGYVVCAAAGRTLQGH